MTTNDLHTRAMLVSLRISAWSARKYDRKVSQETATLHNTTLDAGRYNKCLLPGDAPAYKALTKHIADLRVKNYAQTLPWSDDGWRMLPVKNYQEYTDTIRQGFHTADSLLSDFCSEYPSLRNEARHILNGMYDDNDYPVSISSRFSWAVEYAPVPRGTDFRVTLAQSEIDSIAARTEARVSQAFTAAMQGKDGAVDRLRKVVSAIVEKCSSPDAIFRDSLIGNARELCDVLTRLNVTEDPQLEALRRQTELLAVTEPQTLRDNADVRQDTAKQAQSILDSMTATYGNIFS
jgi:hypothetical protein